MHACRAAAEERGEDLSERFVDGGEGIAKELTRREVDLADGRAERLDRLHEIVTLRAQERLPSFQLLMLLDGQHVHGADLLDLVGQLADLHLQAGACLVVGRRLGLRQSVDAGVEVE